MAEFSALRDAAEKALTDRFPSQAFDVKAFEFSESLHVRWFAGPTDYVVGQTVKRAVPAGTPLVLARWWDAETLSSMLETLAQSDRANAPAVITRTASDGIEHAIVPAGCPGYENFINALAMTDLYQPPATDTPSPSYRRQHGLRAPKSR
jgi:hypothetical protein